VEHARRRHPGLGAEARHRLSRAGGPGWRSAGNVDGARGGSVRLLADRSVVVGRGGGEQATSTEVGAAQSGCWLTAPRWWVGVAVSRQRRRRLGRLSQVAG